MVKGYGERRVTGSQKLSCTIPLRTWERLERALDGGAADSRSAAVAEAIDAWVDRWELGEFQAQGGQISDRDASDEEYQSLRPQRTLSR